MITNEELAHKLMKALSKLRTGARNEGEFRGDRADNRFDFRRFGGDGRAHGEPDRMWQGAGAVPPFGRSGMTSGPRSGAMPQFGRPGMRKRPMTRERILVILAQYPDGVHQKDIMGQAGISPSSLSELIDKLESDGYVERKTDPADKRATLLFLTEKGKARASEVEDEQNEAYQNLFKNLTDDEKQTLSDLLDKIIA